MGLDDFLKGDRPLNEEEKKIIDSDVVKYSEYKSLIKTYEDKIDILKKDCKVLTATISDYMNRNSLTEYSTFIDGTEYKVKNGIGIGPESCFLVNKTLFAKDFLEKNGLKSFDIYKKVPLSDDELATLRKAFIVYDKYTDWQETSTGDVGNILQEWRSLGLGDEIKHPYECYKEEIKNGSSEMHHKTKESIFKKLFANNDITKLAIEHGIYITTTPSITVKAKEKNI